MALKIIVSYDDTDNDRDALALGRLLAFSGAELVARLRPPLLRRIAGAEAGGGAARARRRLGRHPGDAQARRRQPRHQRRPDGTGRARGRRRDRLRLRVPDRARHLEAGHLRPQTAARRPLGDRRRAGRAARGRRLGVNTVGVIDEGDSAARETAESLAAALGATVAGRAGPLDLLVVGSRPEAPAGKVVLSAAERLRGRGGQLPGAGDPAGRQLDFQPRPAPRHSGA